MYTCMFMIRLHQNNHKIHNYILYSPENIHTLCLPDFEKMNAPCIWPCYCTITRIIASNRIRRIITIVVFKCVCCVMNCIIFSSLLMTILYTIRYDFFFFHRHYICMHCTFAASDLKKRNERCFYRSMVK